MALPESTASSSTSNTDAQAAASLKVSTHYSGEAGKAYVEARQYQAPNAMGYKLNFEHFAPYIKPGMSVLDFGCGNGGMLEMTAAAVGASKNSVREPGKGSVEGLEVNPAAAERARSLGYTIHGAMADLPPSAYDLIISNHVLEHVRDVVGTLEIMKKSLKVGGLFVTKLPIDSVRDPNQRTWSKKDVDYHLQTWTPRLFANTLLEAGYEVVESRLLRTTWHPKLFPLAKVGLHRVAFKMLAIYRGRYQTFAVARRAS